tara:strand:- start:113 stop:355 length:243 start_codon:yes stop_codon:yes gene_type:complete
MSCISFNVSTPLKDKASEAKSVKSIKRDMLALLVVTNFTFKTSLTALTISLSEGLKGTKLASKIAKSEKNRNVCQKSVIF